MNEQLKRGNGKDGIHWVESGEIPDRSGVVTFKGLDSHGTVTRRLAANVRGGLAWPFPMQVGTKMVSSGCVAAVAFTVPPSGGFDSAACCKAELLAWRISSSIGRKMGADGCYEDIGIAGCLGEFASTLHCLRWYTFCPFERHDDALRNVRKQFQGQFQNLRVTAINDPDAMGSAREIVWKWGDAGNLIISREVLDLLQIEGQEYAGVGPQPLTRALGAVLSAYESAQ